MQIDAYRFEVKIPSIVYQTLQLDVAECRDVYGISDAGKGYFAATPEGWRRVIDDFEDFGHELPETVIEDFRSMVDKAWSQWLMMP